MRAALRPVRERLGLDDPDPRERGDREAMFLLAGQGAPLTRALSAADLVAATETALGAKI